MAHDINSVFLFIHPPLCIMGYFFLAGAFALNVRYGNKDAEGWKKARVALMVAWILEILGIITGAVWAQLAWGSYWSWDPKETAALVLFICMSGYGLAVFKWPDRRKLQIALGVVALLSIIATLSMNWLITGLHSYV